MNTISGPSNTSAPLVFAIDAAFLSPLEKALRSLAKSYTETEPLEVHVIHTDTFSDTDTEKLHNALASRSSINLKTHQIARFNRKENAEINHGAYVRLAIPALFSNYERVIYLDADIVFTKSPFNFTRFPLNENFIIAASQDIQNPTLGSGIALPGWEKLGLTTDQPYFNSGVMVINPKKWIEAKITEQAINFVQSHPEHLRFRDQDALNYLLRNKWQSLPLRWNYPPLSAILKVPGAKYYAEDIFPLHEILEQEHSAVILHFVGPDKPWNKDFPDSPVLDLYREKTT